MNYLAHLYLTDQNDDGWLGALLGDFVKGPLDERYGEAITHAIVLHRNIDTFTDAHPAVLRSKARVSTERRRYAGIMVDMFYDHLLAKYWQTFDDRSLPEFTARIYSLLMQRHSTLPERLQRIAPSMARMDWLASYAQVDSMRTALDNMGRRLTRENRLLDSADELETHYAGFAADFRAFMPDVRAFASERRLAQSADRSLQ